MIDRGRSYVSSFDWCGDVVECHVGDIAVGGVVVVLLLRIEPLQADVDEWLWVIVGDLPPGYVVTDDAPNPAAALDAYIGENGTMVAAVKAGDPLDDVIPVATSGGAEPLEPTPDVAGDLARRLRLLDEQILCDLQKTFASSDSYQNVAEIYFGDV